MKIKNKIIGLVALGGIIILATVYFSGLGNKTSPQSSPAETPPKAEEEIGTVLPKSEPAALAIDYGDRPPEKFSEEVRNGESLLVFTKRLLALKNIVFASKEFSGLGTLVEQIGEKKNGDGGRYWQYWINGNYAKVGADAYGVNSGDSILWKFANQQGF